MPFCGVGVLLVAWQPLNHVGGCFFFDKVGVFWLSLDQHLVFVLVARHVDGPPLWVLIGLVFRFATSVALADFELGIWVLLALYSRGGCHCQVY